MGRIKISDSKIHYVEQMYISTKHALDLVVLKIRLAWVGTIQSKWQGGQGKDVGH